jgi:DNA-binding MarR family transcriptional regulator
MTNQKTSKKPQAILKFLIGYKLNHDGVAPSFTEIGEAVGITTNSVVSFHLTTLEEAGLVTCLRDETGRRIPRGIKVKYGQWTYNNDQQPTTNDQ